MTNIINHEELFIAQADMPSHKNASALINDSFTCLSIEKAALARERPLNLLLIYE
jgi:hypothetical protein